jgi:hypothetical protein
VPRYNDEGRMCIYSGQKHQPVTVCLISLDQLGLERVIVKVSDEWQEPAPASASSSLYAESTNEDDEIPF